MDNVQPLITTSQTQNQTVQEIPTDKQPPQQPQQPQEQQSIHPQKTEEQSVGQKPTHPDLVMYALAVYGFYYAAKKAKEDILSDDPTAHGLFNVIPLNYKMQMKQAGSNQDVANDVDLMAKLAEEEQLLPEDERTMTTALNSISEDSQDENTGPGTP